MSTPGRLSRFLSEIIGLFFTAVRLFRIFHCPALSASTGRRAPCNPNRAYGRRYALCNHARSVHMRADPSPKKNNICGTVFAWIQVCIPFKKHACTLSLMNAAEEWDEIRFIVSTKAPLVLLLSCKHLTVKKLTTTIHRSDKTSQIRGTVHCTAQYAPNVFR